MNAIHVMEDVSALISLGKLTSERAFYASLNRALFEIGQRFPRREQETIAHSLPTPLYTLPGAVTVEPHTPLHLTGKGVYAYSLAMYGKGTLTVTVDGVRQEEYRVDAGQSLVLTSHIKADTSAADKLLLSFSSEEKLFVTDLALYATPCEEVPQYRPYYPYPTSRFQHRFLAFSGRIMKNGMPFSNQSGDLRFTEDAVEIAFSKDGIYTVEYEALPDSVDAGTREEELYVREDAKLLVPLLTAYYYALEDGHEMADALLARYEAARNSLTRNRNERVTDVNGW